MTSTNDITVDKAVNLNLQRGDILEVKTTKKYLHKPPFQMVGVHTKGKHMRLLSVLQNITPNELFTLDVLDLARMNYIDGTMTVDEGSTKYRKSYSTIPIIKYMATKRLDKVNQRRFAKGLTGLKEKGLVRTSHRNHYMINPELLIPSNYEDHIVEWDKLGRR